MKQIIKRALLACGYELRRATSSETDAFRQQRLLVGDTPARTIFDVGANVGDVARQYRALFPDARVYAFEPFPETYKVLERRSQGDPKLVTCNLALGRASGSANLQVNASSATNSLLETEESAGSFWGGGVLETLTAVSVGITTIDAFCDMNGIDNIDILKIDTQGTERDVLRGAEKMLSAGKIQLVYSELIVAPTYKDQAKPYELIELLDGFGYSLFGLYNLWNRPDGRLLQLDAIFVRSLREKEAMAVSREGAHAV